MFAHRQHQLVLKRGRTDGRRENRERDGRNEEKRTLFGQRMLELSSSSSAAAALSL